MIQLSNPIFISGHTRSGTNLLMRLLDGAEGLIVPPGEGKLNILRRFLVSPTCQADSSAQFAYIIDNIELNLKVEKRLELESIIKEEVSKRSWPIGVWGILDILLTAFVKYKSLGSLSSNFRWLEKNHNLEFYWGRAKSLFGSPKLLFVVRDPLDTWVSWKKYCEANSLSNTLQQAHLNISGHLLNELIEFTFGINRFGAIGEVIKYYKIRQDSTRELFELFWAKGRAIGETSELIDMQAFDCIDTQEGRFAWNYRMMYEKAKSLKACDPGSVMIVRYEDLVNQTEACVESIFGFCGLKKTNINLVPTDNGEDWGGNSSFENNPKRKAIDGSSIGRWEKELCSSEIDNIRRVLPSVA